MKLSGQSAIVVLSPEADGILSLMSITTQTPHVLTVTIEEADDIGLWIRIPRADQVHFVLLRWEYVLSVDLLSGTGRLIGMRA